MTDVFGDLPDPTLLFGQQEDTDPLPNIPDIALTRMIGKGGMGVVYHGKQAFIDREVAVKVLGPTHRGSEFEARFKREAKILAGISHPNVVGCYSGGTTEEGTCYLVMEFVDGPNLLSWIKEEGNLPPRTALSIIADLARALKHAHESSIIHRDIKPANVLLQRSASDGEGCEFPFRVKLADLGLARATSTTEATLMDLTQPGAVMGSPPTMAPEQFDAPDEVDYRTDIYALGCVLYHALTGKVAYPQTTLSATITRKLADESPDPRRDMPELDRELGRFVRRLLAKDRTKRPQSYDEIIEVCGALSEKLGARPTVASSGWGRRVAWAGGALGALLLLWFATRPGETEASPEGSDPSIADLDGVDGGLDGPGPNDPRPNDSGPNRPGPDGGGEVDSGDGGPVGPDPGSPTDGGDPADVGSEDSEPSDPVPPDPTPPPLPTLAGIAGERSYSAGETVRLTAHLEPGTDAEIDLWDWSWEIQGLEDIEPSSKDRLEFVAPRGAPGETVTARVVARLERDGFDPIQSEAISITIETPRLAWEVGEIDPPEGAEEGGTLRIAGPSSRNRVLSSVSWKLESGPAGLPESFEGEPLELTLVEAKENYSVGYSVTLIDEDGDRETRGVQFEVAADDDPPVVEGLVLPKELAWGESFGIKATVLDPDDEIPSERLRWIPDEASRTLCTRTESRGAAATFQLAHPTIAPPERLRIDLVLDGPDVSRTLATHHLTWPSYEPPAALERTPLITLLPLMETKEFEGWTDVRSYLVDPADPSAATADSDPSPLRETNLGISGADGELNRSFYLTDFERRFSILYENSLPELDFDLRGWLVAQLGRTEESYVGVGLTFEDGSTLALRVPPMAVFATSKRPTLTPSLDWLSFDESNGRWSSIPDREIPQLDTEGDALSACNLGGQVYPAFRFEVRGKKVRVHCGPVTAEGIVGASSPSIEVDTGSRPVGVVIFCERAIATWGDLEWLPPNTLGD